MQEESKCAEKYKQCLKGRFWAAPKITKCIFNGNPLVWEQNSRNLMINSMQGSTDNGGFQ